WKLNTAKSDFGMLPGPDTRTDVIEHSDPNLKVSVSAQGAQGKQQNAVNLTTDGKEVTYNMGPREIKAAATWDANVLVINSKLNIGDQDVQIKSKWSLSDDGKTFTIASHYTSAMGETDQKLV